MIFWITQQGERGEPSWLLRLHNSDVIMGAIASRVTSLTIVYSTVYSGADQRKHQSSASLAFVWGIHRWPVNSPHKWPVTRKMFPFDDVIMKRTISDLKTMFKDDLPGWHCTIPDELRGAVQYWINIRPKLIFNPNLTKYRLSITLISVIQSFWHFAKSTTVSLPYSVQNFKTVGQIRNKLWANETSRDFS